MTVCLFFNLSPLGECRITPWKAELYLLCLWGWLGCPWHLSPTRRVQSQTQLAAVHVPCIGLPPRAPEGRCSEIPVWCTTFLRAEYVHCTLQGSEGVFYQLFSLLPSISNISVNLNHPINLPEGNWSPLFLYLIIDFLLQQFISGGRGSGCPEEDASNTASIRGTEEMRASSQCCCHHVFDLGPALC